MKAVLLAAGIGKRLGKRTQYLPKTLIPLKDRPILDYVLETILTLPLNELIVIGGFGFEKLAHRLLGWDPRIRLVKNKNFLQGSIVSLEHALPFLDDEFFLFNADHIYPLNLCPHLINGRKGITTFCDFDRPLGSDDMKILRNPIGRLAAISKRLLHFDGGYVGITYCDRISLPLYRDSVNRVLEKTGGEGVVEEVLSELISQRHPPTICDISGIPWLEVDTEEDLRKAELQMAERDLDQCVDKIAVG
jgi:choline kinase